MGLGGACGQPQTGRHQTARQQRPGKHPLQVVRGVHVVFPLFCRRLVGVVVVHKGRFATDPNNMEYYSCRLFPGFPGPTTESNEGLNGFLTTRPARVLLVASKSHLVLTSLSSWPVSASLVPPQVSERLSSRCHCDGSISVLPGRDPTHGTHKGGIGREGGIPSITCLPVDAGPQYQSWQTLMSQVIGSSARGRRSPGHQVSQGAMSLHAGLGLAWAVPAAGPKPATATPPASSAPAIIRVRVQAVFMSRLFARVRVVLTLCFLFLWVVSGISGPTNTVQ